MNRSIYAGMLLFLSALTSPATTYTFVATGPDALGLSPLNENPPHPESSGRGTALITWDTVTNQMSLNVVFSGLTTGTTAAHIHCCVDPPGNAGVATQVPRFISFPINVTSGTYSRTFDMLDPASYNPAFVSANGGTAASAAAVLLAGVLAGRSYLNIHTAMFGGGEIRGFLVTPVDISLKPGATEPVPINPKSHGKIPVAILSTASFDATAIDTTSLTFGRTGQEKSLAFCNSGEDVNGDGRTDVVCHFETQSTGFKSGDTLGILMGKTTQGSPVIGQQAITTVP